MDREKTLYMYVYDQIVMDIYRGKYQNQDKLPSLAQLCDQYDVGRNTIRTAIRHLEEEGYVISEKGTHARVCFNRELVDDNIRYLTSLAARKQTINDIFDTLGMMMPQIVSDSLHKATPEEMLKLKEAIHGLRTDESITDENRLQDFLVDIYSYAMSFLGNDILLEMFRVMMQSMFIPLSNDTREGSRFSDSTQKIKDTIARLLSFVMTGNDYMLKISIRLFCSQYKKVTGSYIERVCKDIETTEVENFRWISNREQEYLYMQVISEILRDIDVGVLHDGELLPPMASLAKKYQVSLRTMRKVNEVLNEFGIVTTRNGVGTTVTLSNFESQENFKDNEILQKFMRRYCESLEILCYLLKGCLKQLLTHCTEDQYVALVNAYEAEPIFTLQPFFDFIKTYSNSCTRVIVSELEKGVAWNLFMKALKEQDPVYDLTTLHQKVRQELRKRNMRKVSKLILDLMNFAVSMNYQNYHKLYRDTTSSS